MSTITLSLEMMNADAWTINSGSIKKILVKQITIIVESVAISPFNYQIFLRIKYDILRVFNKCRIEYVQRRLI